ncbi:hypothetical protein AMTRI_Chr11g151550 [Amborella trichopoda]
MGPSGSLKSLKPIALMVAVQVGFAGMNIFYKLAINAGMDLRVLVAYRFAIGAAFLGPIAFFLERKIRPKLTWTVLFQTFLCGLFGGTMNQNLYAAGMKLTSATFVCAMTNVIPAVTFILALFFRLEEVAIGTISSQAKVVGTLVGVGGAMLMTFYKGLAIHMQSSSVQLMNASSPLSPHKPGNGHVIGSLLVVASCFSFAIWLIIQAKLSEKFPAYYSSTALMCFMAAVQSFCYAKIMNRSWSAWKLGWDVKLLTVVYAGVVVSALLVSMMSWCIRRRGPLFVSMFNPLMLILVAIAGSLFLGETLHLGNILGSILIIAGLYMVLWGKNKEMKMDEAQLPVTEPSHDSVKEGSTSPDHPILVIGCKPQPLAPELGTSGSTSLHFHGTKPLIWGPLFSRVNSLSPLLVRQVLAV